MNTSEIRTTLGIRGRLLVGFGAILLTLVVAILIALAKINVATNIAYNVVNANLPIYEAYLDMNGQIYNSQAAVEGWQMSHNPVFKRSFSMAWNNIRRSQDTLNGFKNIWSADIRSKWESVDPLITQLYPNELAMLQNPATSSQITPIISLASQVYKIYDAIDGPLVNNNRVGGLFDVQYDVFAKGAQNIIDSMDSMKITEYILLAIGTLLSLVIILFTARGILRPLNDAIQIAKDIADGKRNIEITVTSMDETGKLLTALNIMQTAIQEKEEKLKKSELQTRELLDNILKTANLFSEHSGRVAGGDLTKRIDFKEGSAQQMGGLGKDLNTMTDSLAGITSQITDACHHMVGTLEEVRHAVDAQSSGASEQASSINQITASLEEIEKSSSQTIDKAKTLGEIAERTRTKGQLGLEAVEQSINGMKAVRDRVQTIAQTILDLSNQTRQVGEITSVVNTLAQQSKMLALNASIEAAKAGEAGKGFAVVAAEVKNLAEQSEQSTAQVQKILEDISRATEKAVMATEEGTKGVDQGTDLVEQTGDIVRSLSEVIHETTIASQQIEAAIRQEGIGIEQITAGMNEINQVTSSFVTSVKQTTEAIDNLANIARNLKDHVDVYKV